MFGADCLGSHLSSVVPGCFPVPGSGHAQGRFLGVQVGSLVALPCLLPVPVSLPPPSHVPFLFFPFPAPSPLPLSAPLPLYCPLPHPFPLSPAPPSATPYRLIYLCLSSSPCPLKLPFPTSPFPGCLFPFSFPFHVTFIPPLCPSSFFLYCFSFCCSLS